MRGNRSIFLGLSAFVVALGILGANGYFWWLAQSREPQTPRTPARNPNPHRPILEDREEFANLDKPPEWFSPYRALPDEESQQSPPQDSSWRQYFRHETQAGEISQADASGSPEPEASPSHERPAPLLFPNPAEAIEHAEPPEWLTRMIDRELPKASAEERQVWTEELKGFEPEVVLDILRMKKNLTGTTVPFPKTMPKASPDSSNVFEPGLPAHEKLVPLPADDWSLETDPISQRLEPSLAALEQARDIILNNLANLQTVGFKRSRVVLTPVSVLPSPELLPGETDLPQKPLVHGGNGIALSATLLDVSQGPLKTTRQPLDVAIEGRGFFQVRSGEETLFTRSGLWTTNEQGQICLAGSTPLELIEPLITIPENTDSIAITEEGFVTATAGDSRPATQLGRIQLARFRNPSALESLGGQLFAATALSGPARLGTPKSSGFGVLRQGTLELANTIRDEEQEEFQQIHSHWLLLKKLTKDSNLTHVPGPVARNPLSRTQRASAQSPIVSPPSSGPLKKLGEEGRNLIEEYLESERMKTIKRTLGLK